MQRILDTFMFDGEGWAVRLRALELARIGMPVIHAAVLADRSHQGEQRTAAELGQLTELALRSGADVVHVADLSTFDGRSRGGVGTRDYQVREREQRNAQADAVRSIARSGDLFLVSDADEIPHAATLLNRCRSMSPGTTAVLSQSMSVWSLRWRYPGPWLGTTCALWPAPLPQEMRDERGRSSCVVLDEGGWHLSWQGSPARRLRKLRGFSHAELLSRADELETLAEEGLDINGVALQAVQPEAEVWPGALSPQEIAELIEAEP